MDERIRQEREHFNAIAKSYEILYGFHRPAALKKVRALATRFAQVLEGAPCGVIVEIGGGSGFFTRHLAPRLSNRSLIMVDIARTMILSARSMLDKNDHCLFTEGDCMRLPFADASIAAITGHGVLHHLDQNRIISEISRVLKPGGRIAFYEPNSFNPYIYLLKTIPALRPPGDTAAEQALNPCIMRKLLCQNNFKHVSLEPVELMMNTTPARLIPLISRASSVLEYIPLARWLGGSLRITAERV